MMSAPGSPAVIPPVAAAAEGWAIPPVERTKYDQIFDGLHPVNGMLTGDKVKPVLINSKLPVDVLGWVWDLSDIDKDGMLDREEFYVAMHLVYRALEKEPVPASLPVSLVPPSKRTKVGGATGGVHVLPGLPPPAAVAMGGRDSPSLTAALAMAPSGPVAVVPWVVTPAEKANSDKVFLAADTDMDGFVNGGQVKDFFIQSGLPQAALAHIWTLCDTQSTGQLNAEQFALASHFITLKLKGMEPPLALTPEMVPPSMRAVAASVQDAPLPDPSSFGSKELDMISKDIDDLKRQKMQLEQEKSQRAADIKVRNSEVQALQKELDSISMTLKQLETQRSEAQKRLDELDDRRTKLDATVKEAKEKCEEEQKQIDAMRSQISMSENTVQTQEEEMKQLRDELGQLRLEEQQMEQKVEAGHNQLDQLATSLTETQAQIKQTKDNIQKLQDAQNSINESINQYNALIRGDADAVEPSFIPAPVTTDIVKGSKPATVVSSFGDFGKEEPFKTDSNFSGTSSNTADPFQGEDPFKNTPSDDPFKGSDPFKGDSFGAASSMDPFGEDPFSGGFGGGSSTTTTTTTTTKQDSAWGAFGGNDDPFGNPPPKGDPFGEDPFSSMSSAFGSVKPTTANNDPFQPIGGGGGKPSFKASSNSADPFGADPFMPGKSPRKGKSPAPPPPSLPPKQKKAPPRPPAPKSPNPQSMGVFAAPDPFGGQDPFGAGTVPQKNNDGFGDSNFADFSPSKFSSEAEQLAWATRNSQKDWEQQQKLEKQEKADLELAIALSKSQ